MCRVHLAIQKKVPGRLYESRPTLKRVGQMLEGHPVFLSLEDQLGHRAIQVKARLVHG